MIPDGDLRNVNFVVPVTLLQQIAQEHKDRTIEIYVDRNSEVNSRMRDMIESEPRHFTIFQQRHFGSLRKLRVQSVHKKTSHNDISTILEEAASGCRVGGPMTIVPWGRCGL
jgi:hypothetical protein